MPWLRSLFYFLLTISSISSIYLYNYAIFKGCHFPSQDRHVPTLKERIFPSSNVQQQAPFRLLALGDPQLEGDTSIEHARRNSYRFTNLKLNLQHSSSKARVLREAVQDLVLYGIPVGIRALRKRIDLFGNDYYLAHIYRTLQRQTNPTHVAVLGDLLGSQWITDLEFDKRARRYWDRVFSGTRKIGREITDEAGIEVLGEDKRWRHRIINIAGNHDIGYAGDLTKERMSRFESSFGAANWEIVFQVPGTDNSTAFLRLVILNSMNLDIPAHDEELQKQTYEFINDVITRSEPVENRLVGTILLTHIPFHKKQGVCADGPYFSYDNHGKLREQNHLSDHATKSLLEGIFGLSGNAMAPFHGLGRKGIIVNGHDHEGCDVWHYLPRVMPEEHLDTRIWNASRFEDSFMLARASTAEENGQYSPGMRELTLRSMMGEYGGWGYLISAWFDTKRNEWVFEVNSCSAGVQHIWWAVHILILITTGLGGMLSLFSTAKRPQAKHRPPPIVHKKVPSITLQPPEGEPAPVTPASPPRPPSPFDHFDGKTNLSGGRARRRRLS